MTETSIPNNETTPEAVTATPEEAQTSTIAASEVPEHPFARIGEDGTVYVKDGDEERVTRLLENLALQVDQDPVETTWTDDAGNQQTSQETRSITVE